MKKYYFSLFLTLVIFTMAACGGSGGEDGGSTPSTQVTPGASDAPDPVSGLTAYNAYDGKVNLAWAQSGHSGFDHYNLYKSTASLADVKGLTPFYSIPDEEETSFQVIGLEVNKKRCFAVTAVDKDGRENTLVSGACATPVAMPQGEKDPDLSLSVYKSESCFSGTTLLTDLHDPANPRVVEVNMNGEIVWKFDLPESLKDFTNPGMDAERLPNKNTLILLPNYGVIEVSPVGAVQWTYEDPDVSHDADRLANGNTIMVFGNNDELRETHVKEVNPEGQIVWSWNADEHFFVDPYMDVEKDGWTHTNAVTRLESGNTLINLRNFFLTVEVDRFGKVVWRADWSVFGQETDPHDPEITDDNRLLVALQKDSKYQALEIERSSGETVWAFTLPGLKAVRDANRLPNGNTLLVGILDNFEESVVMEVTPEGEVVWQLAAKDSPVGTGPGWFYKAQRLY